MSNHQASGTLTADGATTVVTCSGYVTMSAHFDSGSGTLTWQFMGPDGVWRSIYGGSDFVTEQAYTASNMVNMFFANDVQVRGNLSSSTTPQIDWQIFSNPRNRI